MVLPKLSVCMPTYNGEKYIGRQIESILAQMHPHDELVISDDSSTDGTLAVIAGFKDPRIRLSLNNVFHHPAFNMENALKMATGDIIVMVDQDDEWLPGKLPLIRSLLCRPKKVEMLVLDGHIVDGGGDIIDPSIFRRLRSGCGILKNLYANTYMGCCMAFSRALLDVALPFPKKIPMHDQWLGLLAEIYGIVGFYCVPTIKYFRRPQSVTELGGKHDLWRTIINHNGMGAIKRRFWLVASLVGRALSQRKRRKGCR